jgi:hypothetical protein
MEKTRLGPWVLDRKEITLFLFILVTHDAEMGYWADGFVSSVRKSYSAARRIGLSTASSQKLLDLIKSIDATSFEIPLTTLWGQELKTPKGVRQYLTFLQRMDVGDVPSQLPEFLGRVSNPPEISARVMDMLTPYLPKLGRPKVDWNNSGFGPGIFSDSLSVLGQPIKGNCSKATRFKLLFTDQDSHSLVGGVPKTWKSDRIIAAEPLNKQLAARSVAEALSKEILRSSRGSCDIHDQAKSRAKCKMKFDTFDFSAGSDHVRTTHVRHTMPTWYPLLMGVRTNRFVVNADLLKRIGMSAEMSIYNTSLGTLFGTMGSTLTFPTMTWVLYAYSVAILRLCGASEEEIALIQVYGDDVILPHGYGEIFITLMTMLGFVINDTKSFYRAEEPFRETCGMETYLDQDITPIRVPRGSTLGWWWQLSPLQIVDFINECYDRDLYTTASLLTSSVVEYKGQTTSVFYRSVSKKVNNVGSRGATVKRKVADHMWINALSRIGVNDEDAELNIDDTLRQVWRDGRPSPSPKSKTHIVKISDVDYAHHMRKAIWWAQVVTSRLHQPALNEKQIKAVNAHCDSLLTSLPNRLEVETIRSLDFIASLSYSVEWNLIPSKEQVNRERNAWKEVR